MLMAAIRPLRMVLILPPRLAVWLFLPWLCLPIVHLTAAAASNPLQLRPATNLYAGGVLLNVGTYAIPCVTDWNGDGKKDLLVGYQTDGMIRVYTNSGTDARPVFTSYYLLQAGGTNIQHTSSGCGAPAAWVCDFDGDGKRDLLVGSGTDGRVNFYRNTNTDAHPILEGGRLLTNGSLVLTVGLRATPFIHDWDEDGLPDLLCGDGTGNVWFFKNTNTAQGPIYAAGVQIKANGAALNPGARSVVRVFDWDGDGLKDLVCSSATGVYWCRNTNSNSNPILQAPLALQVPAAASSNLVAINTGARMRLDLVDWNNDGVMDLILGNADGTVFYYEGYRFAFTSPACPPSGTLALQWNSAPCLKYNLLVGSLVTNIQAKIATNVPSGGLTTCWTNVPQGSQQFYRVQIAP